MPAFAYLRKSVVRVDDPTNSAEAQEAAVRAMAARYGDAVGLVILSDWDKSGRLGRTGRPGYDAVWQAIESGTCTALYSYSLSRVGRSVSELSKLFEVCAARSIPIRLTADSVDTSTASGRMTANILASVAAFEADVQGERLKAAYAAKATRGERIGTVPYFGDKPGEDATAVLAAFRSTGSYNAAAALLNATLDTEQAVKPRATSGRRGVNKDGPAKWWASSVQAIVKRLDPSVMPMRPAQGVRAEHRFILSRLLTCPTCSTFLTGGSDRDGRRVRYLCRLGSVTPHPRMSVTESHILEAVKAEVAHLKTPSQMEAETGDEASRRDIEGRRLRTIDSYVSGIIDRADRDRRLKSVVEALAKLELRRVVLDLPEIDWGWSPRALNLALSGLFERIELDPETFQPLPDGFVWTIPEWRS